MTYFHKLLRTLFVLMAFSGLLSAQDDSTAAPALQVRGYVKNLQVWSFTDDAASLLSGGFFHHRLQLEYLPAGSWSFDAELRNRLFYGEYVRVQAGFAEQLDLDNGVTDLSWVPIREPALVGSMVLDRLYGQFMKGRWQIRLGRQRINWGVALIWNPNDWFNAYNFLDFDYEERPGSDALRVHYQTGAFGAFDLALSPGRTADRHIAALRYGSHTGRFDWQVLAGWYREQLALGGGWAGDLGQVGFKGEWSVFQPLEPDSGKTALSASLGFDYLTGGQLFLSGGFLLNTRGQGGSIDLAQLSRTNLSPDNLMPGKISLLLSASYPVTPLINAGLSTVYSPNGHLLIVLPTLGYSLAQNWEIDLTGQLFWLDTPGTGFGSAGNGVFLRTRWSY